MLNPAPDASVAPRSPAEPAPKPEDRLRARRLSDQLRESEERFRTMADCAPVLLWMAEPDGLCTFFNKTWLEWTGRSMDEESGNGWAEGVHPEDFQACMHTYLDAFIARQPFRMEYRLRRADGVYRWILDQGVPRTAPGGKFAGYIGSCIDITDIREAHQALERVNEELEQRVQERTAALRLSNSELEQFAYIASHDLQAPLRAILGYIQLIQSRYKGRLDADADEFFQFITDGAHRMNELIRDLLTYSRTGRSEIVVSEVDCNKAVEIARDNLQVAITESGASVEHEQLPTVPVDEMQLVQLFQNLIGNAIKFHGEAPPVVRIKAEAKPGEWQFSVTDNGIGISAEHSSRIFQVFQRLHTAEQYPGTGIGLAICKKIVERHGGRIWLESEPGKGSTFHFTLPKEAHVPAVEDAHAAA